MELPGLDGSALNYVECLREAGIVEQGAARRTFVLKEPITVSRDMRIVAMPSR